MDRRLPPTAIPVRTTPTFTATSVPSALLGAHHTTVWAELIVLDGTVAFEELDPRWHTVATIDHPVVIVPDTKHRIAPSPDARFFVQFYSISE